MTLFSVEVLETTGCPVELFHAHPSQGPMVYQYTQVFSELLDSGCLHWAHRVNSEPPALHRVELIL